MRATNGCRTQEWPPSRVLAACVVLAFGAFLACKDVTLDRANQAPVTLASATPASGPAPLTVAFAGSATDPDGSIAGYAWTFGDGATSSLASPTHLYATAGSFTAMLEVTDNAGAKSQATVDVAVSVPENPPPTATASATPISGKAPLLVTFTGSGTDPNGTIASYAWMFGDGGSSTLQNPTHTYQTSGNFIATLTVTDNGGATGSSTVPITAGSNQPPTASASPTQTSGKAPLLVAFTGTGTDTDGTIVSYGWTFGDGGTSSLQNPTHTYQSPGNYSATLTVTDNNGAKGTSTVAISAVANQPPTAAASANPTSGLAPLAVAFAGSGSDSDGTIASYAWTFGDGGTSNVQNPSHTYQTAGNFNATLMVTDNNGATGSSNVTITVSTPVNQPPAASASATPTSGKAPLLVAFTGTGTDSDGTIVSYGWAFGDGGTSSVQNPSHTYQTAGNYNATLTVTDNSGAKGTSTVAISAVANQPPTATASATPTSGLAPLAVNFTGSGSDPDGTIASYAWTFGDGGTSNVPNPSHTYQTAGSYNATLTVTDNNGATGSSNVVIAVSAPVNQPPTASASATPTSGKAPLVVTFSGTGMDSDGTIVSYGWAFGDGGTSSVQNPSHTYQTAGNYNATLTVTDNSGATGSSSVAISASAAGNQPPTASAAATPTSGKAPLVVAFTGSGTDSDGTIASYAWTFGDSGTSSLQNPSHTFSSPGNYTATLTVTDNGGATGSSTVGISVVSNQPPTASVSATPTSGTAPLLVTFTGSGTDPDGTIASYAWAFGDGGTSSLQNPTHTYASAGSYTATLTVTDNNGATGSSSVAITVAAQVNQPPTASASATPTSGKAPLVVAFTGSGSDSDGTIASYAWMFGDGGTSIVQNPSHTYLSAGNYTATLTVTDNGGATGSSTVGLSVVSNQPPTASASATPTSGTAPLLVTFTGSGTDADGTIASYAWAFGDAGTSSLQNPTHTYASAGSYTATLTVTDNNGATSSSSVGITVSAPVNQPPTASATATPTSGKAPLVVAFTGSGTDSDGTIASYAWTFGDGGTANVQNPSHTYLSPGNFNATLTVTDNGAATGSSTVAISVVSNQPPTASASATPLSGTAPLLVTFTGSGTDPDGTIVSYAWTFGDAGTSSLQNPTHTYASAGSYTATLTVTDNNGATGSSSIGITVSAPTNLPPIANAGLDQINLNPGVTVLLNGTASSDPDGSITSYQWTQTAGTTVTLTGANTATPSFVAPVNATATYTFTLTVTDNGSPQLSAQDAVTVTTRVTYLNTTKAMIDARANQPSGTKLGCTQSGCHTTGGQSPPLLTYTNVFNNRSLVRGKIQTGQSMRQYLLTGEPAIITSWIDNGAPEKN